MKASATSRRGVALAACLFFIAGAVVAASPPAPPAAAAAPAAAPPSRLADRDGDRISDGLQARLRSDRAGDLQRVIVTFRGAGNAAAAQQAVGRFEVHREFHIIRGFAATMSVGQLQALARHPAVFRIEEDFRVVATLDAARRDFGADAARSAFDVTGVGIKGCIVDTGVDPNHEQLNAVGLLIPFFDAIHGRSPAYDDHGHGTHVASTAFGDGVGGTGADTYRGVAPGVTLYAAKVLDQNGSGSASQVIAGIEWCAAQQVHIMSMSLGTDGGSDGNDAISQAVNTAVGQGLVAVVAAGNAGDAPGSVGSPGAAAEAITVGACAERSAPPGAVNHSDGIYVTSFSSRGPTLDGRPKPDVCAPGHSITAAKAGTTNGYVTYSGTSMATPFVAGTVALGLQAGMTAAQVRQHLEATAQDRGPAGKDNEVGAGLVDAYAFVARAKGTSVTPTAFPTSQRIAASVGTHGLWTYSFSVGQADLGIPIAAVLTIDGQEKCTMFLLGLCFSAQWDPDLEAKLIDPNGVVLSDSYCLADDECGTIGRQETLHAMPTVAGTYTIQVFPAEDSGNNGKGGSFALDLSRGPLAGPVSYPAVHVGVLTFIRTSTKTGWKTTVTVPLHLVGHGPFTSDAVITGEWSGGYSGLTSCSTVSGECAFSTGNISKRKGSVTFTLKGVSGSLNYQPGDNHQIPTAITVTKP